MGQLQGYNDRLYIHETLRYYCKLISTEDYAFVKSSAGFCRVIQIPPGSLRLRNIFVVHSRVTHVNKAQQYYGYLLMTVHRSLRQNGGSYKVEECNQIL